MKRAFTFVLLFLLFIFLLQAVSALNDVELNSNELELSINVSNKIPNSASVLILNLSLFPFNDEKQETILTTEPETSLYDIDKHFIIFNFSDSVPDDLEIKAISHVKNKFVMKELKQVIRRDDIQFPSELSDYVNPSKFILSNDPYIESKARQLATNDVLETLYNIGEYVRTSMIYDLDYQELQNSSWIMQERKGVCSHYAILFISFARSLGIPARYVGGVAYSNKDHLFREHAWAEVYLNGQWIPYDAVYGEYGWIDASHVAMKKTIDAGEASLTYQYIGKINPEKINVDTKVIEAKGRMTAPIELKTFVYVQKAGLYSFIPLEITVKNNADYYISTPIRLSTAPGVYGNSENIVFLKPGEEKKVFFIISIPEMEECYGGCMLGLGVEDSFGNSANTSIYVDKDGTRLSLQEVQSIIEAQGVKEKTFDFYCKSLEESYYDYENASISCVIKNLRGRRDVSICNQDICENITIGINETQEIGFDIPVLQNGPMHCLFLCIIAREKRNVLDVSCINTVVLATPNASIISIEPTNSKFGEKAKINLTVESNYNMDIILNITSKNYRYSDEVFLKNGTNIIPLEIKTWKLDSGNNPVSFILSYDDKNNRSYESRKEIDFNVQDVNIIKKIFIRLWHIFG